MDLDSLRVLFLKGRWPLLVRVSCVCLLSAITCCELDMDLCHFDVDETFVQSERDKDVFRRLPKGYYSIPGKIVRLNKSLYGINKFMFMAHTPRLMAEDIML